MMTQTHQYDKAPITEAVIDIKVVPQLHGNSLEAIQAVAQAESDRYPIARPLMQGMLQLGIGMQPTAAAQSCIGVRLSDVDEKNLAQMRLNGLTFSRLNPYQGWHIFQPEARRLWSLYTKIINPLDIIRVAVRYINRIDLPEEAFDDLGAYLTVVPQLNSKIDQKPGKFLMQLQIPQNDVKAMLILTEASTEPPAAGKISIVLDIDLYRDKEVPKREQDLWALFEQFHERKNEIFEACITSKVRSLIK